MKEKELGKRGREPKLTRAVEDAIIENIRNCATQEIAARSAGISYRTLRNWLVWGEAGREPYFHFFQALTRARVEVEYKLVDVWWKAAQRDWRAAMALLEQRFPETYGKRRLEPEQAERGLTIHICQFGEHDAAKEESLKPEILGRRGSRL